MVLVGGAILPHGALVLDPSRDEMPGPLAASAKALHDACAEAATAIEAARPDLILLYTPHGLITDAADMHVYVNQTASGSCEWMGSWGEHRVSVRCDPDAAHSLVRQLRPSGDERVATLCAFSGYDAPLRWGETVPLAFLHRVTAKPGGEGAKVVILSHGPATTSERCKTAAGRMEATRGMGTRLGIWASERAERVFFVVSGDLSHAHGNGRAPRLANGTPDRRYTNPKYGGDGRLVLVARRCLLSEARSSTGTERPTPTPTPRISNGTSSRGSDAWCHRAPMRGPMVGRKAPPSDLPASSGNSCSTTRPCRGCPGRCAAGTRASFS